MIASETAAQPAPAELSVREHSGPAALEAMAALAAEWERLRSASERPLCLGPDWVRAHVDAFESPARLRLLAAHAPGGELRAVLPLIAERGWFRGVPVRRLRGAAGVHSLRCDVVAAPGAEGRKAAAALTRYLLQRGGWDVVELRDVPAAGSAYALLDAAAAAGAPSGTWTGLRSPVLDLVPPPGNDLPPGQHATSAHFRAKLRTAHRRLERWAREQGRPGSLRLRRTGERVDAASWRRGLDEFYGLEAAGWKGRERSAIACDAARRHFYDAAAEAMTRRGAFVLHRLELDGTLLAACYGLDDGRRYDVVKWAYDENFARFVPGHLLIEAIVADCCVRGVRWFHLNGTEARYKRDWTPEAEPLAYLYVFRPGRWGRTLRALKFVWTPRLQRLASRLRQSGDP